MFAAISTECLCGGEGTGVLGVLLVVAGGRCEHTRRKWRAEESGCARGIPVGGVLLCVGMFVLDQLVW